jgi:hypothetical protein
LKEIERTNIELGQIGIHATHVIINGILGQGYQRGRFCSLLVWDGLTRGRPVCAAQARRGPLPRHLDQRPTRRLAQRRRPLDQRALTDRVITFNPCETTELPKMIKKSSRTLTPTSTTP